MYTLDDLKDNEIHDRALRLLYRARFGQTKDYSGGQGGFAEVGLGAVRALVMVVVVMEVVSSLFAS